MQAKEFYHSGLQSRIVGFINPEHLLKQQLFHYIDEANIGGFCVSTCCKHGHTKLLLKLINQYEIKAPFNQDLWMVKACGAGQMNVVRILLNKGFELTKSSIKEAAKYGRLEVVEFWHSLLTTNDHKDCVEIAKIALDCNNIGILHFFHQYDCGQFNVKSRKQQRRLFLYKHLDTIDYLYNRSLLDVKHRDMWIDWAVDSKSIDFVKYVSTKLHPKGDCSVAFLLDAIREFKNDIVEFILNNVRLYYTTCIDIEDLTRDTIFKFKNFKIFGLLWTRIDQSIQGSIISYALGYGLTRVIQFIVGLMSKTVHGLIIDQAAISLATKSGNLKLVKYLQSKMKT